MATWRRKDGSTFEGDEGGNPIDYSVTKTEVANYLGANHLLGQAKGTTSSITFPGDIPHGRPTTDPILNADPNKPEGIRPGTFADKVFNFPYIGTRHVVPTLEAVGGELGAKGIKVPYAGRALGYGLGYGAGANLRTIAPSYFGTMGTPGEEAARLFGGMGLDYTTSGVSKLLGNIFPSVARENLENAIKKSGNKLTTEQLEALKADPNFPVSVGQVKGGLAEWMEKNVAPQAKIDFQKDQINYLRKQSAPHIIPDRAASAKGAQWVAGQERDVLRDVADQKYAEFEPAIKYPGNAKTVQREIPGKKSTILGPNGQPITLPPTYENIKIEGAIPVTKAHGFADRIGSVLDEALGPNDINALPLTAASGTDLVTLRNEINKLRGVQIHLDPKTKQPAGPIMPFESTKVLRDMLSQFANKNKSQELKTKLGGGVETLRDLLAADMDEGVKSWGPNSYTKYRAAQDHWQEVVQKLKNKTGNKLLFSGTENSPDTTPMQVAKWAKSDPHYMQQFIEVAGRPEATKMVGNDIAETFSTATGGINVKGTREYLANNREVVEKAIPSNNLTNVNRFLNRADLVEDVAASGKLPLALRIGTAGMSLAVGAGSLLTGGGIPMSGIASGGVLGGLGLTQSFVKNILLNSRNAHLATGLLDADPKSAFAKKATRAILLGLKGTQVEYMAPDNNKYKATITDSGQIKILDKTPIKD